MSNAELQTEEREVLKSIYDGDGAFKEISDTTFQYKYGENETIKSFLLEISWGEEYPTEKPIINMNTFYNRNLLPAVKDKILTAVDEEANQWIGCSMTYNLFECLREKIEELLEEQTEVTISSVISDVDKIRIDESLEENKKEAKREVLTKSQKRKAWDRAEVGKGGERPRGWDWIDIVKHLSQVPHSGNVPQSNSDLT